MTRNPRQEPPALLRITYMDGEYVTVRLGPGGEAHSWEWSIEGLIVHLDGHGNRHIHPWQNVRRYDIEVTCTSNCGACTRGAEHTPDTAMGRQAFFNFLDAYLPGNAAQTMQIAVNHLLDYYNIVPKPPRAGQGIGNVRWGEDEAQASDDIEPDRKLRTRQEVVHLLQRHSKMSATATIAAANELISRGVVPAADS